MDEIQKRIDEIKSKLNLDKIQKEIQAIEVESGKPEFWQDTQTAAGKMQQLADLNKTLEEIKELEAMAKIGTGRDLDKKLAQVELKTFLSGKFDELPVIFSIHAGQGGTEAMDWAEMLKRMYLRFFERKGWVFEMVEETAGDEAGIKSVTYLVNGRYVYGYLKYEAGTHRLVRQSPFNADKLRQTSFALVEVLPQVTQAAEVEVKEEDLDTTFFHSSSHGGQNVQKVSTAVRIRHKPTGLVVACQSQRYQEQNRKIALDILKAKLWEIEEKKRAEEERQLKGGRTKASWGTQIRSYVLHPYKMVKDLRTGFETGNPDAVLDGNLDGFIEAEIRQLS
jgi:peptide chain release factor 2